MLVVFTLCILLSGQATADSFRCGRALAKAGDSTNTLIKKCGEPGRKYSSKDLIDNDGRQTRTTVSNWVYTRNGRRDMIVTIYSGVIAKIRAE